MSQFRANGCGIANNNVGLNPAGGFTLNVPDSQAAG